MLAHIDNGNGERKNESKHFTITVAPAMASGFVLHEHERQSFIADSLRAAGRVTRDDAEPSTCVQQKKLETQDFFWLRLQECYGLH